MSLGPPQPPTLFERSPPNDEERLARNTVMQEHTHALNQTQPMPDFSVMAQPLQCLEYPALLAPLAGIPVPDEVSHLAPDVLGHLGDAVVEEIKTRS